MFSKSLFASLALGLLLTPYAVYADVATLYIPLRDPSVALPSADVLGTDNAGHTTWRLSPGQPSGTLSSANFPAQTLIEGPDDVQLTAPRENGSVQKVGCGIKDGVAVCTPVISASGTEATLFPVTETVRDKSFTVQVTEIPKNTSSAAAPGSGSGAGAGGKAAGSGAASRAVRSSACVAAATAMIASVVYSLMF